MTARARWACLAALPIALMILAGARGAEATLSAEREAETGGCVDAASYFPEDQSPAAERARRRCRLENLEKAQTEADTQAAIAQQERQTRALAAWMQTQGIPNRIMRRNSVDLFLGFGVTSYGIAIGGLIWPAIEAEAWLGRASDSESAYDSSRVSNRRNCLGARGKWLMLGSGNITPYIGLGMAGCLSTLDQHETVTFDNLGSATASTSPGGDGTAHFVTGAVGLTWMEKSGFRLSLEYVYAYAFYTQARLATPQQPDDETLRQAWANQLTSARSGARLQVGYAF